MRRRGERLRAEFARRRLGGLREKSGRTANDLQNQVAPERSKGTKLIHRVRPFRMHEQ